MSKFYNDGTIFTGEFLDKKLDSICSKLNGHKETIVKADELLYEVLSDMYQLSYMKQLAKIMKLRRLCRY